MSAHYKSLGQEYLAEEAELSTASPGLRCGRPRTATGKERAEIGRSTLGASGAVSGVKCSGAPKAFTNPGRTVTDSCTIALLRCGDLVSCRHPAGAPGTGREIFRAGFKAEPGHPGHGFRGVHRT
jgi:hypothetical protein